MRIYLRIFTLFLLVSGYSSTLVAQTDAPKSVVLPAKLQLAVDPGEITLTKGITVGAADKTIHLIVRETSGVNPAHLELVAQPFLDITTGDLVDAEIVTTAISAPQAALNPGGLHRAEVTIGGFRQAGTYLGGITVHDTVSGEQKTISIRVSVKDAWWGPTLILLLSVFAASGVNAWTQKGRRKRQFDQQLLEFQHAIKLAGGAMADPFLFDAEQLLTQAQTQNQEFRFDRVEAYLVEVRQKLAFYEQRQHNREHLQQKIQDFLHDLRELGETDPQQRRLSDELLRLLATLQSDYEQSEALVPQLEQFFRAYRLARKDLQAAQDKLLSTLDYVKKADKSKIELYFREIERLLITAETMRSLDEANTLLRKVAYELSPEKINANIFQEQKMRQRLLEYEPQIKAVAGTQMKRILSAWHEHARHALEDNRYEDVAETLQKLDKALPLTDRVKQVEERLKGRDQKMTELRRLLRNCKDALEQDLSWEAIQRVEWDVGQIEAILDGQRAQYEPFQPARAETTESVTGEEAEKSEETSPANENQAEHLRPLAPEDMQQQLERVLSAAEHYPKLRGKLMAWKTHGQKLLQFEELSDLSDYLRLLQDELNLYARLLSIRTQAEERHLSSVLRLTEQAETLFQQDTQDERSLYHRAEVLVDAANSLLQEPHETPDLTQVISFIRSPKTTSQVITYGTLTSYFVVTTILGLQMLYTPDPDFGALVFKDYFSLLLWALGLEGARLTLTNIYEVYFKKE